MVCCVIFIAISKKMRVFGLFFGLISYIYNSRIGWLCLVVALYKEML